jgi:hypothetical protein
MAEKCRFATRMSRKSSIHKNDAKTADFPFSFFVVFAPFSRTKFAAN